MTLRTVTESSTTMTWPTPSFFHIRRRRLVAVNLQARTGTAQQRRQVEDYDDGTIAHDRGTGNADTRFRRGS